MVSLALWLRDWCESLFIYIPEGKKDLRIGSIDIPVFLCYDIENERRCLPCKRYSF